MSGPSKEEREENARQEKNNARFLADLLAQKLANIFGEQLKKLQEIAENTKPLTEEGGFKLTRLGALASAAVAGVAGRPIGAAKAIKDSSIIRGAFIKGVKNPLIKLFKAIGNFSFGRSGDQLESGLFDCVCESRNFSKDSTQDFLVRVIRIFLQEYRGFLKDLKKYLDQQEELENCSQRAVHLHGWLNFSLMLMASF